MKKSAVERSGMCVMKNDVCALIPLMKYAQCGLISNLILTNDYQNIGLRSMFVTYITGDGRLLTTTVSILGGLCSVLGVDILPASIIRCKNYSALKGHPYSIASRFSFVQPVAASDASLQNPANIPVVLASSCVLYQTQKKSSRNDYSLSYKGDLDCLQKGSTNYLYDYEKNEQIFLPLGMVVNAVFKNKGWLYVQTPHGEEGYVSARVCLPLGILPPPPPPPPVIRPIPSMPLCRTTRDNYWGHVNVCPPNKTDTEKLRDTVSEGGELRTRAAHRRRRGVASGGGCRGHMRPEEAAVDRLFLKATAATSVASTCGGGRNRRGRYGGGSGTQRETLLLIRSDYHSAGCDTISVDKGDVVALVSHPLDDWFWVRAHDGTEGFIPSAVAGHGYI